TSSPTLPLHDALPIFVSHPHGVRSEPGQRAQLPCANWGRWRLGGRATVCWVRSRRFQSESKLVFTAAGARRNVGWPAGVHRSRRSEEHTSELQSPYDL